MSTRRWLAVLLGNFAWLGVCAATAQDYPLVFFDDFSAPASVAEHWRPSDPNCWRLVETATGERYYSLFQACQYEPPVRAPRHVAWLKDHAVSDFDLRVRARSTTRNYAHRDLCIFFAVQDASHCYYAHLGLEADAASHNVMIVDGTDRRPITVERTNGVPWTDGWHELRVLRDSRSGRIEVFFDDMEQPVLRAVDTRFAAGRIGIGSFDDLGDFSRVELYGRPALD